jgi:hypothetical protein
MFEPLTRLIERIKSANENELSLSVFVIPEIKQFIIRLNLVDQLYTEGLDVNDKIIGTYSYMTALSRGEDHFIYNGLVSQKKYGEPYTLFDTGEFYESFRVRIEKDGFVIEANTVKEDKDLMDLGEILGLNASSKDELSKKMLPFLQKALREYLLS